MQDISHVEPTVEESSETNGETLPLVAEQVADVVAERLNEERAKRKAKKAKKKKKQKGKASRLGSDRGIETMFRSSYRVQMDLSALADTKANIMITINGLILSIILASAASKIDSNPYLLLPTSVLLIFSVTSVIFAVLAAIPRYTTQNVTLEEAHNYNLLFFGNFSSLTRDEYRSAMTDLMKDTDRVYQNMIEDVYGIGMVLNRKFRMLRASYIVFMIGMVIGVLLYIGTFLANV